ncbi:MAG: TerB family tellurite resistance protein [Pseudomonadota bacterium]
MINKLTDWWHNATAASTDDPDPEHAVRRATAALMIEISRSDTEIAESERAKIAALVQARFALSDAALDTLVGEADDAVENAVSLVEFSRVLVDELDTEARGRVVDLLWEVALADGSIDRYEDYYIRKIADLLYVSHARFIQGKLRATGEG